MEPRAVRVVICDDDALARRALGTYVASSPTVELVGMAATGREAVQLVGQEDPDVVLLDVRMPGMDGQRVAEALRASGSHCRIIYLTSFPEARLGDDVLSGLVAGALTKDLRPDTLIRAIHNAADGLTLLTPATSPRTATAQQAPTSTPTGQPLARSEREEDVLRLLCQGASNAAIAKELSFSESWVKTTLRELMRRTGTTNRVELVLAALDSPQGSSWGN